MNDRYRFLLGATIVLALLALAMAVALGHVEEKTSYGLTGILTILGKIALDFGEWAFRSGSKSDSKPPQPPEPTVVEPPPVV